MARIFYFLVPLVATTSVLGPPALISQPPEEVWYQLDVTPGPHSLPTLSCQATDNVDSYIWLRNGVELKVGDDIKWVRPGQSGSIVFVNPKPDHQGYYQCFVSNIFGTAVTNKVHLQIGVLEHFPPRPIRKVQVTEGDSLTLSCKAPRGAPEPTVFWLYRDTEQDSVIETIRRRHITADPLGRLHFATVQQHDGRANLLYECAATSPVLHGEYRSGDQIQLEVVPREVKRPVEVHQLYVSPDEITVKAGGKLKIQCIFGGTPIPTVFWSKQEGDLPKFRMRDLTTAESDFGNSLVVDNVHPEDAGRYECRAQHLRHTVNVRVLAAPYWDLDPPRDVIQSEESTTELECLASGQPPPIIRWSKNGRPLHEFGEDPRRILLDNGRLLRLKDLNQDLDTGVYQCNASNPLGYVYANAFVNVKAHAPRFLMPMHRVWKVVLKSTVHLNCDVDAAPEGVVRWVDSDDRPLQIVAGKTQLLPNNTFVIFEVSTADEGLYYCNVSNKYGINRASNLLEVYKPTYFVKIPSPKHLSVEAGHTAELFCEAVSDPRLPIQYKWTINGHLINESKTFQILSDRLRISGARGRHSGIIDCAAITDVDVKLASMEIIVKDVPSNPVLEDPTCSERKATIKWNASNSHGDAIKNYIVEVQTDFKKNVWEQVSQESNTKKKLYETDITLTPWVNYTFRVVAKNSHGRSDSVVEGEKEDEAQLVQCHTRASFPYTNPSGVWAEGNEADNLVIYWNPMDKYYWNAPNLHYLIRYKLNEPHTAWTEFLIEDSLANQTIIREQPTFREYLVQVRAMNAMGPSILEPETVKGYSGEDVPSAPPATFRLEGVRNYTTVELSWDEVLPNTVNGRFEGYQIEYWRVASPGRKYRILIRPGSSNKTITSLSANTNYSAIIRTKNKHYVSVASPAVSFETPEGIPSKVHNLRVYAVGAYSILVEWEKPKTPNGVIRGYFLAFQNDKNETEETYVLYRNTHYLHEKSLPDTGYKVSVWAETSAGEGPSILRPVRTWPVGEPDKPFFKVTNISLTTATIEWVPANNSVWRMPGSAFSVNYSLSGEDDMTSSELIYLPNRKIVLNGLTESTRYVLVGVAKDGNLTSYSMPLPITTQSRENASQLNQESLRTAAWFVAVLCAVAIALLTILITCCCEERKGGKYAVRRKEMEIGHQLENEEERKFLEYQYGYKD